MDTLFSNKHFIKASTALAAVLSLFVLVLFINEVKAGRYIGRGSTPLNSISVSGKGEVTAVSDIATITVNVTKDATTTKEAQSLLNASLTKVLKYLKDQKIDDKDIKSEYGGVYPKYSTDQIVCFTYPCPQPSQKVTGYTASQSVTIKVREVDSANTVRTGLADLGITDISGPTFSIDNEDSLKEQARAIAIKDARAKAEVLAKELGVDLGEISSFSDNSGGGYPLMYADSVMNKSSGVSAPAPDLPKGENKITSNVTISFEIK
ncbi:MAG: SIMPL domain-containing protein [bacterium]